MAILREKVEAMKAIWTEEEGSYHGEHVNFDRIWSYPKPAQRPHPPMLPRQNREPHHASPARQRDKGGEGTRCQSAPIVLWAQSLSRNRAFSCDMKRRRPIG